MAKNGLKFITKSTFTTASSVSIDNCFSATYTHYIVKRNLLCSSAGSGLDMRLRGASTDASGANYRRQYVTASSTSVSGGRTTGATSFPAGFGDAEGTSIGYGELWISNPFEAVRTTAWVDYSQFATSTVNIVSGVFAHDLTTSYDGLTIIPGAGTITGSISIWGLVKS